MVVPGVCQLSIGFGYVGLFAHDDCGRSFVCWLDDDVGRVQSLVRASHSFAGRLSDLFLDLERFQVSFSTAFRYV